MGHLSLPFTRSMTRDMETFPESQVPHIFHGSQTTNEIMFAKSLHKLLSAHRESEIG